MKNAYTSPEVVEVGNAAAVILGNKVNSSTDFDTPGIMVADNDLDD